MKPFYSNINQNVEISTLPLRQTLALTARSLVREWWDAVSLMWVMGCEQLSSVWIGGRLDGVPTQTRWAVLCGPVGQLPSATAVLHAVHTAQSHAVNQTHYNPGQAHLRLSLTMC